jgi:hypothetical protein
MLLDVRKADPPGGPGVGFLNVFPCSGARGGSGDEVAMLYGFAPHVYWVEGRDIEMSFCEYRCRG